MFEIGSTLREARVRRKLTLQQVEDETKIRLKYIQAMENEDFEVMPGATYVKGFLRTYSTYLGVDADIIIDEYTSRSRPLAEHEPFGGSSALGRPYRRRRSGNLLFVAIVALLVVGLLIILGYHPDESPKTLPQTAASPKASPTQKPKHSTSPSPKPTTTPSTKVSLRITASSGDCWVTVQSTGPNPPADQAFTLKEGQSKTFTAGTAIELEAANPQYLTVRLNGKDAALPGSGLSHYRITAKGIERL